jgi:hypothetical protein
MQELRPRNEAEFAKILEGIGLINAYRRLAAAALRGPVSDADRRQIEAEILREIGKAQKARDEFPFSVDRAVRHAQDSLQTIFDRSRPQ